jgi:hypothetical protein
MGDDASAPDGFVSRFRHYATEFRSVRSCDSSSKQEDVLANQVGVEISVLITNELAPAEFLTRLMANDKAGIGLDWSRNLCMDAIGYRPICRAITILNSGEPTFFVRLEPGWIAAIRPAAFPSIAIGMFWDRCEAENAIETAYEKYRFLILGYCALACESLADWIDEHHGQHNNRGDHKDDHDGDTKALSAVVSHGLATTLQKAASIKSIDRVTAAIREVIQNNPAAYDWSADDWVGYLKAAKRTVIKSQGWKEILAWRDANRVDRAGNQVPKGTRK